MKDKRVTAGRRSAGSKSGSSESSRHTSRKPRRKGTSRPTTKDVLQPARASSEEQAKPERVQKALSRMGFGSRRELERLIGEQKIRINGQIARLGDHVVAGDKVSVGQKRGVVTTEVGRIRVLLYNKPEGEICTRRDEEGRRTVFESIGRLQQGRWISVGRLDINSSGLLLFTNYGELANHLMHPSSDIEREYAVRVNGEVTEQKLRNLLNGVELDDGTLKFDTIVDAGGQGANHWYHVIIKEGKNREVRRLWQSQDVRVSRLIRVRYGNLVLPRDLRVGRKTELSLDEIKQLFDDIGLKWPRAMLESDDRQAARKKKARKKQRFSTTRSNSAKQSKSELSRDRSVRKRKK